MLDYWRHWRARLRRRHILFCNRTLCLLTELLISFHLSRRCWFVEWCWTVKRRHLQVAFRFSKSILHWLHRRNADLRGVGEDTWFHYSKRHASQREHDWTHKRELHATQRKLSIFLRETLRVQSSIDPKTKAFVKASKPGEPHDYRRICSR